MLKTFLEFFVITALIFLPKPIMAETPNLSTNAKPSNLEFINGKTWKLIYHREQKIFPDNEIIANFTNGSINGSLSSGCNLYSGSYVIDNNRVRFSHLLNFDLGCSKSEHKEQERAYLNSWADARVYRLNNERLEILDSSFEQILIFEVATNRRENHSVLTGTKWILTVSDFNNLLTDKPMTLNFEKNKINGFSGCNFYSSYYKEREQKLFFGGVFLTHIGCRDSIAQQESEYLSLLFQVKNYYLENQKLILLDDRGKQILNFQQVF